MPNLDFNKLHDNWWSRLALAHQTPSYDRESLVTRNAQQKVLLDHEPVAFVNVLTGDFYSTEQLQELLSSAAAEASRDLKEQEAKATREEHALGWQKIEEALSSTSLATPITEGRWAGFTRGEAIAWSWNLFQFEPRGGRWTSRQLYFESRKKLEVGELTEVFDYPERAKGLAELGIGPREYRKHKEAAGEAIHLHGFNPQIRSGRRYV